jgi:hypothetical protein
MTGMGDTRRSGGPAGVSKPDQEHGRATPETPGVRVRVHTLTAEEKSAGVDDINARMAQLKQQWERSGQTDVHALRGALIFLEMQLPPWVFSGVMQWLKVQEMQPPYHEIRWLMVRQGYDEGLDSDDASDNAVKKLAGTPAHCKRSMMMKSYQKIERRLPPAARRVLTRRPRKQRIK